MHGFFFSDRATTEISPLSLHDALPILYQRDDDTVETAKRRLQVYFEQTTPVIDYYRQQGVLDEDRKSTRLNSSHANISYAVFCLKNNNLCYVYYNRISLHGALVLGYPA